MHEYSLALDIMATLKSKYPSDVPDLTAITLSVGQFSGAVTATLDFCLHRVLEEEELQGVKVVIREEPAVARCSCGKRYNLTDVLQPCPACGSFDRRLVAGKDIVIQSIEVAESGDLHGQ